MKHLLYLCVFLILGFLKAQTPQQSYFEWTQLPFSKDELAQRRSNLVSELTSQNKNGIVIFLPEMNIRFMRLF